MTTINILLLILLMIAVVFANDIYEEVLLKYLYKKGYKKMIINRVIYYQLKLFNLGKSKEYNISKDIYKRLYKILYNGEKIECK